MEADLSAVEEVYRRVQDHPVRAAEYQAEQEVTRLETDETTRAAIMTVTATTSPHCDHNT